MSKVGVYNVDITPSLGIEFIGYHRPSGISNIDVLANENMQQSKIGWNVTLGEIGVNRREISSDGKVILDTNLNGTVDKRIGVYKKGYVMQN